ncbi:hypothetical protein [Lacrimispora amygdalina]|uniref:hypothetical protein n=1 Tax=Lacrimispora amygdalina TaxID=253257 RepID=UPI000BE40538|nr:hypothetical protein [Lacrimispora amygdalina]
MKHSTFWIFILWCMGIGFLGYLFIEILNNIVISTKTIAFVLLIDFISVFSIVWLGISRWIIETIVSYRNEKEEN